MSLDENVSQGKENASSVSSSASFKKLNVLDIGETAKIPDERRKKDKYFSNDDGTIDSEAVSSDGTTAINNINLQKNFFSNDRNVFNKDSQLSTFHKKEMHTKKLSEIQVR